MPRRGFDAAYYEEFYGRGSVHTVAQINHLATGVHSMLAWWGLEVRSFLDIGAGPGYWRDWYRTNHPKVTVVSTDVSDYACATYGHKKADIAAWRPSRRFDLVVCHSVLQYPDNAATRAAIENLGAACRHFLYLEIPTASDFDDIVDPEATDMSVHRRTGTWYRRELGKHFRQVGGGLWLSHDSTVPMYELEMPANDRR
ncbi:MAG: class I SAM-dependent methyltransferase [Actinomycetota bacterium]